MAVARYDLGLTEEEFWDITPAQFDALNERHVLHKKMEDYRAGLIASILCNIHREQGTEATEPADFFTDLPRSKPRTMSGEEIMAHLKKVTAMMPSSGAK